MEQRLDTLETGLATVTHHLTEINENIKANSADKQSVSAESMLLTRLDLMDVGCLLESQLTVNDTRQQTSQELPNEPMSDESLYNETNNQKITEDFDTLILE
jgi:hypothetical protein